MPVSSWRRSAGLLAGILAALCAVAGTGEGAGATQPIEGFSASGAAAQAALERRFDADISPTEERAWLERLAAEPNQVGSRHDRANAQYLLGKFREWGWDASIETFSVLYPTPREVRLELTAPTHYVAKLREPTVPGDRTSSRSKDELPPYNVYGADGDVRGELVYVNYGMPGDYKELDRLGIAVKGRIVLARYGGGWRGLKPKLAFEHGALGCIIYSDPRDDGYGAGDVYPKGGYRPADGVQRGSVEDMTLYSGDPLTPGVGATPAAKRLTIADAPVILKIPVLPISYADAQPLLAALGGPIAPQTWRGGLPLSYHTGPGPAAVHLRISSEWGRKTIYDVIAKLTGTQEPDRWIIRGNHHDAWVFGATDPLAGTVALMSEAKAIGALVKQGWRPRRTLIYASWDAEEPGLIGSTEWAEEHAAELQRKAALYVNSDTNGRGHLEASGTQGLGRFVSEAARDVRDPETGASVLARALATTRVASYESGRDDGDRGGDLQLTPLGSGSDYTPFLQHLGVNSVDLGFGGEADYGVYHSAYDSFDHFRRFGDPSFEYEVALAKVGGRLVLRASQADLLPENAAGFADSVAHFTDELHKLTDAMRNKDRALDRLIEQGAFKLAEDPTRPLAAPARGGDVPYLQFAPLDNAVARLKVSAGAFDRAYARAAQDANAGAERERLNTALGGLEETLTNARGLPRRPWYRHMIYAPGAETGYGVKTLPGVREAIEGRRWDEANDYIGVVAAALDAYRSRLDRAIAVH